MDKICDVHTSAGRPDVVPTNSGVVLIELLCHLMRNCVQSMQYSILLSVITSIACSQNQWFSNVQTVFYRSPTSRDSECEVYKAKSYM